MMSNLTPSFVEPYRPLKNVTAFLIFVAAVVIIATFVFVPGLFTPALNSFLWIGANIALAYTAAVLAFYVLFYFFGFRWQEYSGGRAIMASYATLLGVVLLAVVGIFFDSSSTSSWLVYPPQIVYWRPSVRFIVYVLVAITSTRLAIQLIIRYRHGLRLEFQAEPKTRKPDVSVPR